MQSVKQELLALSLEDWIPLPEAVANPEVLAEVGPADPIDAVSAALIELVEERLVRLYRGCWDDEDPASLADDQAIALLADREWYRFHLDDPNEERLWFVNIENIREESSD